MNILNTYLILLHDDLKQKKCLPNQIVLNGFVYANTKQSNLSIYKIHLSKNELIIIINNLHFIILKINEYCVGRANYIKNKKNG